jgi:hypothetical protein
VGAGCGRCKPVAGELLVEHRSESSALFSSAGA